MAAKFIGPSGGEEAVPTTPQPCPRPSNSKQGTVEPASKSGPQLDSMHYELIYTQRNNAPFTLLEPSGRVTGLSPGYQLHFLLWTDPKSWDREGRKGNGRYSWEPTQELKLDQDGCWSLKQFDLGYADSPGLDYRFEVAMLLDSQRPCLDKLHKNEKKGKNPDDLDPKQLSTCGLTFLGHVAIPT